MQKKKKWKRVLLTIFLVICMLAGALGIYAGRYYHMDETAQEALLADKEVSIDEDQKGTIAFIPNQKIKAGLIFYPGAKVEYTAYAPLMKKFAEDGILCVLVKMPLNIAILDINAADGIENKFPQVENWYIGGHSLGGAVASMYCAKHVDDFKGEILLAAYSIKDVSDTDLNIALIHGSDDQVLNMKSYEKYRNNVPDTAEEVVIEGGNHCQFGNYGFQKGDGEAEISAEEQQKQAAEAVEKLINE